MDEIGFGLHRQKKQQQQQQQQVLSDSQLEPTPETAMDQDSPTKKPKIDVAEPMTDGEKAKMYRKLSAMNETRPGSASPSELQPFNEDDHPELHMTFTDPEAPSDHEMDDAIGEAANSVYSARGSFPPPPSPPKRPSSTAPPSEASTSLGDLDDRDLFVFMCNGGPGRTEEDWNSVFSKPMLVYPLPPAGISFSNLENCNSVHAMPLRKDQVLTWTNIQRVGTYTSPTTGLKTSRVKFALITKLSV